MQVLTSRPLRSPLAVTRYPAQQPARALTEPLVLLHGWGCDSRSWAPLIPHLQQLGEVWTLDLPGYGNSEQLADYDREALLALIEASLPARAVLVGWSLGGMLALALAERHPERVTHLITLAANLCFVARRDWPAALAPAINRQFQQAFAQDAPATLKHFAGLVAKGDAEERPLLKRLRPLFTDAASNSDWLAGLTLLAQLDNRAAYQRLPVPGLHLLAEADALVPAAAAGLMQPLNPRQRVQVLNACGHALHWSQPAQVAELIAGFLRPDHHTGPDSAEGIDKRRVAQSFSRAATSYDSVAGLQRAVGEHLLRWRAPLPEQPLILDLGCGTGYFTEQLALTYPGAALVGLDIAQGMLSYARRERAVQAQWLGADAEALPLADASVDLIYSSLVIQWCNDLPALCREWFRVLKPGGQVLFSTLGPETLHELKSAWQQVDDYVHVNRFESASAVREALRSAGFSDCDWQEQTRVLRYSHLQQLTRELKALGAHNINPGQPGGLTGRRKIEALKAAYEQQRDRDQLLPASYQVYYCHAHK